jgi:hypothetical protein
MGLGSTFGVSPGEAFFEERGYYRSGSLFKRHQDTGRSFNDTHAVAPISAVETGVPDASSSGPEALPVLDAPQAPRGAAANETGHRLDLLV